LVPVIRMVFCDMVAYLNMSDAQELNQHFGLGYRSCSAYLLPIPMLGFLSLGAEYC